MSIEIQRSLLEKELDVLELSSDAEGGRTSQVLVEYDEDEGITLKTTNMRLMTKTHIEPDNEEIELDGSDEFMLNVSKLQQWVKNSLDDSVTLEKESDSEVKVVSSKGEGYFQSLDPSQFPSFLQKLEDSDSKFKCRVDDPLSSLSFVEYFARDSSGSSKYQLAEFDDDSVMGSNGQVITIYESDSISNSSMKVGADELKDVIRFFKKKDKDKEIEFLDSKDTSFVRVEDGTVFGYTKPVDGLPSNNAPTDLLEEEQWEISTPSLLQAVRALEATSDADNRVLEISMRGEGEEAELDLSMNNALNTKDSSIEVNSERKIGTSVEKDFRVNIDNFEESLALYSDDTVTLAFKDQYIKLHNETEEGDAQVCIIALQVRDV